ncbi:outer membrane lipoprotein carrier protein LolA [Kushneria sp. AK178]
MRLRSLFFLIASLPLWLAAASVHAMSLEALADHLAAPDDVTGRFEQTRYLADLETRIDGRGHYRFEQGDRVIWTLESPVEETMELSRDGIRRNGERINDDPAGVATLIMQLLNGRLSSLSDRFEVTLEGDEQNWHATLVPRQQGLASYLDSIDMRGDKRLEQINMAMADGDRLDIHLLPPGHDDPATDTSSRQAP